MEKKSVPQKAKRNKLSWSRLIMAGCVRRTVQEAAVLAVGRVDVPPLGQGRDGLVVEAVIEDGALGGQSEAAQLALAPPPREEPVQVERDEDDDEGHGGESARADQHLSARNLMVVESVEDHRA